MISAKVICDSINPAGVRITTLELEYPRIIHAEFMTHRMFSRNAQSSRAIPVERSIELSKNFFSPLVWGKNKAGMSSNEELSSESQKACSYWWQSAVRACQDFSERMSKEGLHKQWANRPLEWFSNIKVVVTATEWENFLWLRDDPDAAQPEIVELARMIKKAMEESKPQLLQSGQWHLPYISSFISDEPGFEGEQLYHYEGGKYFDLELAKKVSASCCASVSYRRLDVSATKALEIYHKLFSGPKPHLSPVEHIATPMVDPYMGFESGVTHQTINGQLWSNNLRGWVQYRKLLEVELGHNTLR